MSYLFESWSFGFEMTSNSRGWQISEYLEQSQSKIQNLKISNRLRLTVSAAELVHAAANTGDRTHRYRPTSAQR